MHCKARSVIMDSRLITPEGTKDFLFDEVSLRHQVSGSLCRLFESRGYAEVETPFIEYLDVFLGKGRGMPVEDMYKMVDREGRLMALRPDSTTPIARLCATRLKDKPTPIRLFYNQSVYSATKVMSGRRNEVLQCGIELISESGLRSDLEELTLAAASLERLSGWFRLEIGHIGIFNSIIDSLKVDDEMKEQVRGCIEAKNYPALNDTLDKIGQNEPMISVLKQLPRLFGGQEVFKKALELIKDEKTVSIINYLEQVYNELRKLYTAGEISVDLGIVNRNDYYTGIVFKGYIQEYSGEAVLSGGRYDNLIGGFGRPCGAIGFGINVDAAAKAIEKNQNTKPSITVYAEEGYEIKGLALCEELANEYICEFSLCQNSEEARKSAVQRKMAKLICVGGENVETEEL